MGAGARVNGLAHNQRSQKLFTGHPALFCLPIQMLQFLFSQPEGNDMAALSHDQRTTSNRSPLPAEHIQGSNVTCFFDTSARSRSALSGR